MMTRRSRCRRAGRNPGPECLRQALPGRGEALLDRVRSGCARHHGMQGSAICWGGLDQASMRWLGMLPTPSPVSTVAAPSVSAQCTVASGVAVPVCLTR